ncbi:MAG: iron ABC transporter permease [Lachnospiraceae bacterium]|nr:iron ABC transporter permease [Lachnospiraceae bacterium]
MKKRTRTIITFAVLAALLMLMIILNTIIGSVDITLGDVFGAIFARTGSDAALAIIWQIRLPRIVMAILLGGALSLAGFLLQTFFNNPIAGPFILGISAGAKMVVAFTMIVFLQYLGQVSSMVLVGAAFIGAMLSILFVLFLAEKIHNMSVLLVGGMMISYICSALTDLVVTFAEDSDIVNLRGWSLGSFSGMTWENVQLAAAITLISLLIIFLMAKPLGAYQLGEAYAQSMGVNIKVLRVVILLFSGLLAACVTAFAGPISFVGIAVPHLVKRGLNTAKPILVVPGVFLGGAVFVLFCDLIARTAFAPTELNISTVTAIFGAPIVIMMLLKRHKGGA